MLRFAHRLARLPFPEKITAGLFFLLVVWLTAALTSLFNIGVVITSLVLVGCFWASKAMHLIRPTYRHYVAAAIAVPLMLLGLALLRGFFTGDAYSFWLPWGLDIATLGHMPQWISLIHMPYTSYAPFWALWIGAVFTILPASEFSVAILPTLFFTVGIMVVIYWLKERGFGDRYIYAAVILIVFNAQSAFWSWNLLAESLLFLGTTLFFYFFDRAWSHDDPEDWYWIVGALVLVIMTKISGLVLFAPLVLLMWRRRAMLRRVSAVPLLIVFLPFLVWLVRNYLLFDNPIFPLLNDLIGGSYAALYSATDPYGEWAKLYPTYASRALLIFEQLFITFPFIWMTLIGFSKSKKLSIYGSLFGLLIFAGIFVIFSVSSGMRYLWPYIGLFSVYAVYALREITGTIARILLWSSAAWVVCVIPVTHSESPFIQGVESQFGALGTQAVIVYDSMTALPVVGVAALCILAYIISKRVGLWRWSLVILYALSFMHLRWIANKSFVNTWSFVALFAFLLIIAYVWQSTRARYSIMAVFLGLLFVSNSYAQAAIYYGRQGYFEWPQAHVYKHSRLLLPMIKQAALMPDEAIVTLGSADYYVWYEHIPAITLNSFVYAERTGGVFEEDMSARHVYEALRSGHISLVIHNTESYTNSLASSFVSVLDSEPSLFVKQCIDTTVLCVWSVNKYVN